ncbi:MAG: hypothetical protein GF421_13580 [Candidatus Aminicenantes bacterium]|nr:hypothetical protein [Candidatus Aminicenantes bacterium]
MNKTVSHIPSKPLKEECFSLSLKAHIQGRDAKGNEFREKTSLKQISSERALFELKTKVLIGTTLRASLAVPKTLFLEHPLKLIVLGEVTKAAKETNNPKQQNILLKLFKHFDIEKDS